jgi:hypothetical protein
VVLAGLGTTGWALASTAAVVVFLSVLALSLLRLGRAKRVKLGLTSIELESADDRVHPAEQADTHARGNVNVTVSRNRFKGDVGDISGIKATGTTDDDV